MFLFLFIVFISFITFFFEMSWISFISLHFYVLVLTPGIRRSGNLPEVMINFGSVEYPHKELWFTWCYLVSPVVNACILLVTQVDIITDPVPTPPLHKPIDGILLSAHWLIPLSLPSLFSHLFIPPQVPLSITAYVFQYLFQILGLACDPSARLSLIVST